MKEDPVKIINENMMRMAENLPLFQRFALGSGPLKNVTMQELHTISLIGRLGFPRMSELARRGHVTMGTMTVMINKLVRKGYVKRERDDEDRRVVHVSLTARGRKANRVHEDLHQNVLDGVMGALTKTEQRQLAGIMQKLSTIFGPQ